MAERPDHADLWQRVDAVTTDAEKHALVPLLVRWQEDTGTLVAYENDDRTWTDCEPDWRQVKEWLA